MVSGDSVPTKHPDVFANPGVRGSITGSYQLKHYPGWYDGSQWVLLSRDDAIDLVNVWPTWFQQEGAANSRQFTCKHGNKLHCPDEQYIQTVLHRPTLLNVPIHHQGGQIMEQDYSDYTPYPCDCMKRKRDYHAAYITDLDEVLTKARHSKLTFAARKIGADADPPHIIDILFR